MPAGMPKTTIAISRALRPSPSKAARCALISKIPIAPRSTITGIAARKSPQPDVTQRIVDLRPRHEFLPNPLSLISDIFRYLIIQVTHPPLGQCLRGFRGGGREPGSPWCSAPVPDRAADRGRSACATARRQMHQMDNQIPLRARPDQQIVFIGTSGCCAIGGVANSCASSTLVSARGRGPPVVQSRSSTV